MNYWFRALNWVMKAPLRPYVLLPLMLNIGLFICLFVFGFSYITESIGPMIASWMPGWEWLASIVAVMVFVLVFTVFMPVLSMLFSIFGAMIIAPFCGLLADKTARLHSPNHPFPEVPLSKMIANSIVREVRKLMYFIPRVIILLILSFIPVINIVMPLVWLIFGAWMLALQYADFAADNDGYSFNQTKDLLWQKKNHAIGMGIVIYFIALIPILNFIVIPVSVIAGTLLWIEQIRNEQIKLG
jgi:CysZ protein